MKKIIRLISSHTRIVIIIIIVPEVKKMLRNEIAK